VLAIGRGLDRSGAASCAATSDDRLFAGMIVASAIGLFVIPMLYFTFQKPPRGQRRASPAFEQREESGVLTLIDLLICSAHSETICECCVPVAVSRFRPSVRSRPGAASPQPKWTAG